MISGKMQVDAGTANIQPVRQVVKEVGKQCQYEKKSARRIRTYRVASGPAGTARRIPIVRDNDLANATFVLSIKSPRCSGSKLITTLRLHIKHVSSPAATYVDSSTQSPTSHFAKMLEADWPKNGIARRMHVKRLS